MNVITEGPEYLSLTALAHELGWDKGTLQNRMQKLGIEAAHRDMLDARKRLISREEAAPLFLMYGPKKGSTAHAR